MLDCLKNLSEISVKALVDKEFLTSVKKLLYVISGQPVDIKNANNEGPGKGGAIAPEPSADK